MLNLRSSTLAIFLGLTTAACAANPARIRATTPHEAAPAESHIEVPAAEPSERPNPANELLDKPVGEVQAIAAQPIQLVATESQPLEAECPAEGTRVLLIGDSLSVGLGHPMARLAKQCGTPFYHHGVVGSHATQWVSDSWLVPQLERAKPTHVLLSMGGNDFVRNDPETVQRAVDGLVAKIRSRGIELLWISPPTMPFEDKAGVRHMWQQAIGAEAGTEWYPSENLEIARARDKIHPTPSEYRNLSDILWRWMSARTMTVTTA